MPRRLPLTIAACLALGWLLTPARGQAPAGTPRVAAPALPVHVELVNGDSFDGGLALAHLQVGVDYGSLSLRLEKVTRITFAPRDGGGTALDVTFLDKSHLTATVDEALIPVQPAAGERRDLAPEEVAVIEFVRPKDESAVAILIGLLTLTLMEVVLGVDNVIVLTMQAGKLPAEQRPRARRLGLILALGTRILLLLSLNFLMGLTKPVFVLPKLPFFDTMEARGVSWRDLILLAGGLFLIAKSTFEMHEKFDSPADATPGLPPKPLRRAGFGRVIVLIAVFDIVFSLDSVITAVGMVENVMVMIAAMILAMLVMLVAAGPIGQFVDDRPTVKVLALAFLILIGVMLVAESLGQHIDKGYIYFAMAFSVGVEVINARSRKPVG